MFADLGLIDEYIARGLVARMFQFWDRPSGRKICEFDHDVLKGDTRFPFVVQTEQHKLAYMAIDRLRALGAAVHFGTPLDAGQLFGGGVGGAVDRPRRSRAVSGSR